MITETVLEMHYHRPIMDLVRSTLGLGSSNGVNFFKYSPQREVFVGFDQAYVSTELSENEFFQVLMDASMGNGYQLDAKYIGFFLQFKVVREMQTRTKYTPSKISNRPHYRISLDTTKNVRTGVSQHELLFSLNSNPGALVYYACPMIFDRAQLYEINVDLTTLRLADISSCPSPYTDNDNHFVFFNDKGDDPIWCSEPVEGKAIYPKDFALHLSKIAKQMSAAKSAIYLLETLMNLKVLGVSKDAELVNENKIQSILPLVGDMLTIIKIPSTEDKSA